MGTSREGLTELSQQEVVSRAATVGLVWGQWKVELFEQGRSITRRRLSSAKADAHLFVQRFNEGHLALLVARREGFTEASQIIVSGTGNEAMEDVYPPDDFGE